MRGRPAARSPSLGLPLEPDSQLEAHAVKRIGIELRSQDDEVESVSANRGPAPMKLVREERGPEHSKPPLAHRRIGHLADASKAHGPRQTKGTGGVVTGFA